MAEITLDYPLRTFIERVDRTSKTPREPRADENRYQLDQQEQ